MQDVASCIRFDTETRPHAERRRVQLTTDGLYWYVDAGDYAFGADVDYAMQQKQYSGSPADKSAAARYSPAKITSVTTEVIKRQPESAPHQHELRRASELDRADEPTPLHPAVQRV